MEGNGVLGPVEDKVSRAEHTSLREHMDQRFDSVDEQLQYLKEAMDWLLRGSGRRKRKKRDGG